MKKAVAMLLALSMTLAMSACASGGAPETAAPEAAAKPEVTADPEVPTAAETETSSPEEEEVEFLGSISCGIHQGGSANCAAFLVDQLALDEKHGFELELVVSTGPNVYASVSADEMNVGFLGNGMAWHYFEENANISMLTIDNLTDDDKLLMRKEAGCLGDGKDDLEALYEMLPEKTIALDLTTTPGVFFKNLVSTINEGRDKVVWYEDIEGAYPEKGDPDMQIKILNTANANITAAMEDKSIDGCICFGSVRKGLQSQEGYTTVSSAKWHLGDTLTPSQYCVNSAWAAENPQLVQAFMDALLEAFDYRAEEVNWDTCIEMAMAFDQLEYKDYDMTIGYWPTRSDLKEWFSGADGIGWKYLENIRNSHVGSNDLTDENMKSVEDVLLVNYLLEACE